MALDRLTKVDGGGISTTSDYRVGIITATKFVGPVEGSITSTDATFTGNVTIGGTLTYEDVTNIDSVGIITARNGIDCNGDLDIAGVTTFSDEVNIIQGKKINFGNINGTNGHIYYDGSTLRFQTNQGLNIGAPSVSLKSANLGEVMIDAAHNGAARLFYDYSTYNTPKLVTTATGVTIDGTAVAGGLDISGDIDVDGHTNLDNVSIAGVTTAAGTFNVANILQVGTTNDTGEVRIGHDGSNYRARLVSNSANSLTIDADGPERIQMHGGVIYMRPLDSEKSAAFVANGPAELYHNDIRTAFTDVDTWKVHGRTSNSGMIEVASNQGANNNDRFRIHKTSAASRLTIQNYSTGSWVENIRFNSDGEVSIATGSNTTNRLTFGGGVNIYHDNNFKIENATGYLKLQSSNNLYIDGAELFFRNAGGTNRWKIDSSGHFLPGAVGSYNIGSASAEIGDVYIADDKRFYAGSDQNISIFHSSSNGINHLVGHPGNMFYHSGTHYFTNSATSQVYAQFVQNSYCELRHSGNLKFRTSETGIDVTGEVAASQDYPNFQPTIDFNFASEKKLDSRITYSRTGPASFTDEFGKVVLVGDNVPRFDHDPDTRESKGLLIEATRTNLWLYSEDLVTYVTGGELQQSTLANTTATTDPTGGTNAVKMAATATGGGHSFYKNFNSGSNGNVHTASVWVKAAGVDYARIYVDTTGGNMGGPGVTFSTGNTWNVSASGVGTQVATSVVKYPNGWWRLSVSGSFSNQTAYFVHVDIEGGEGDISYNGNGSNGIYVWGVQFESGPFPTSYIPTNGSTSTRGLDLPTVEGTDFSNAFGTEFKEFSLVADYDNTTTTDGNAYSIIDLWGESTGYDDRIEWFKDNASPYHIETRAFGGGNATFANGNLSASSKAKSQRFATSWFVPDYSNTSSRRFVVSMGGEAVDVIADNSGTTVPQLTRMGIGCNPTRFDFSGGVLHFKRLMVYNKTLSDGQLQNLSA